MRALAILLFLALVGCTSATTDAIDAFEAGVVEPAVDKIIVRGVNRVCKGPIDIVMRAVDVYPALLAFMVESCPETYGRLVTKLTAASTQATNQATINMSIEDLRALLAAPPPDDPE